MKNLLIRISIISFLLGSSAQSGEISAELRAKIDTLPGDRLVKVWIKLPQAENSAQLKAAINRASETREGRYQAAYDRLRTVHENSQRNVLARLGQLQLSGECRNIKPSWLANLVEVEMTAGELESLANRNDIETIYPVPFLTLIEPDVKIDNQSESQSVTAGVEPNLTFIKAPQAWAAGYTGAGRVVCSFDTGVDGDHPALLSKWKGLNADSSAAWLDQRDQTTFPNPVLGDQHGTHVMGVLVGHAGADTVGVALNAKWISAAVVDITGASYIDAFEWAANPDGDPNSVDDVPDVINHSWGIKDIGCQEIFFDIIDNLEALGIVNIFAAGNDGPLASTIRNPANGADDSLDCFAVGNVTIANPPNVVSGSSRGPSNCTGGIKPNVCGPGQGIRSTFIGTGYGFLTGTSISTPHVSGLVALLRQKNPNATVDQIKLAILNSTQYRPSPPNNDIGWGVIDCLAALNALSSSNPAPNVRLYKFDHNPISAGSTVGGKIVLQNLGAAVAPLSANIIGSNPAISVIDGSCFFGALGTNDTLRATDSIKVLIVDSVSAGTILSMNLRITDNAAFTDTLKLFFLVEPATARLLATHDNGLIKFTVSNFGTYGFGPGSFFPMEGYGFSYDTSFTDMFESGLLIGYNDSHISDGIRNVIGEPDGDFRVMPGGNIAINLPGAGTAQKIGGKFNDSRAENPIGVEIRQFTYTFSEPALDDFVIMRYLIKNANSYPVTGMKVGMYIDWDVFSFASNAGGFDAGGEILWTAYNNGSVLSAFRGITILDGTVSGGWTSPANVAFYPEGFTEMEKNNSLGIGFGTAATYAGSRLDLLQVISAGPMNFAAGETKTITFALLAGNSLNEIQTAAGSAATVNDTLLNSCCVELRGDVNNDGTDINVLDLTYLVDRMFRGGPPLPCPQEADLNGDGAVPNVLDLTYLVDRLFRGGPDPIPCPGY